MMSEDQAAEAEAAAPTPRLFGNAVTGDQALTTQEPIGSTEASEQNNPPSETAPEISPEAAAQSTTGLSGLPSGGLNAMGPDEDDEAVEAAENLNQNQLVEAAAETQELNGEEGPSTEQIEPTGEVSTQTEPANKAAPSRDLTDPNLDLSTLTVEELEERERQIHIMIDNKRKAEKQAVLAQIIQVAGTYHVTLEDIVEAMGGLRAKRKGSKAKPKYKDPATGTLWSGRGKAPNWIKGKNYNDFLIKE